MFKLYMNPNRLYFRTSIATLATRVCVFFNLWYAHATGGTWGYCRWYVGLHLFPYFFVIKIKMKINTIKSKVLYNYTIFPKSVTFCVPSYVFHLCLIVCWINTLAASAATLTFSYSCFPAAMAAHSALPRPMYSYMVYCLHTVHRKLLLTSEPYREGPKCGTHCPAGMIRIPEQKAFN